MTRPITRTAIKNSPVRVAAHLQAPISFRESNLYKYPYNAVTATDKISHIKVNTLNDFEIDDSEGAFEIPG